MKFLLRRRNTRLLLADQNAWTTDQEKASHYLSTEAAIRAAQQSGLHDLEVVIHSDLVAFEASVPVFEVAR